jgi:hypothetical protein
MLPFSAIDLVLLVAGCALMIVGTSIARRLTTAIVAPTRRHDPAASTSVVATQPDVRSVDSQLTRAA